MTTENDSVGRSVWRRRAVGLLVACVAGAVLGTTHAPIWLAFAIVPVLVFVIVPWVVEGVWLWQLRRRNR